MNLKIIFFTILLYFNLLYAATLSLESGSVTIDNSETAATCKTFRQTYSQPPVVYIMMDTTGNNNAIVKLTNVSTTNFCAKVMETIFFDGPHNPATVNYIAIPQGVYRLPDGTKVEAGIKTISNVINDDRISDSWTSLTFSHAYSQSPSVITQLQTMNNELPEGTVSTTARGNTNDAISIPWVTESVSNITSSSAQIALDKSHIIETGLSITKSEKVGYFIIESNKLGSFTASDNNPVYYQTFLTGNVFGGYYTNGTPCNTISINTLFPTSGYLFVASKAINNSSYGGWMRKCSQTNRNIGLLIDSKQSKGSGKISGNTWTSVGSPDYGLSTRDHPPAPASIAVFSRSFDLSRVVNDANLSVSASAHPSVLIEAGTLTMDVNVSNKGPDSAPNTILSLSLPSGMTYQQISSGAANWGCSQNSNALDCNLTSGSLTANSTSMLSLKFSAPAIANFYTINISAASDGLDDDGAGTTAQFQVYNLLVDDDKVECPNASFNTISAALNFIHSGDTLRICKGTYTENVVVNFNDINITSDSANPADVLVKGSSSNAFTINKSNVGIKNLSITQNVSNSRAVLADNAANLTLDNLIINYTNGNNEAIKLQNSSTTPTLKNLSITSDQSGIKMDGANGFSLSNLNITAGTNSGNYGIYGWNINTASSLSQINVRSGDNAIAVASGQSTTMTDINASSSIARAIYISNGTFSLTKSNWASNTLSAQLIALEAPNAGAFTVQNTTATSTADTVMKFGNVGNNTFTFTDNNITGNSANSYGVYIDGGGSASVIQRNIIKNAITNQGLRLLNNPTFTSKITNNCFMNNLTHNANVSNSGSSQFSGNFWGDTNGNKVTPDYTDAAATNGCGLMPAPIIAANYRFDECVWNGTSGEVKDSSGNNYSATPKSANGSQIPKLSTQIINNGVLFARANQQYIELPTLVQNNPNFNNGFTVTAWAKFSASAGSWERVFDFGNGTNINNIFLGRQGTSNNLVLGIHDPGTDNYLVANNAISDTNWHFWGATCDGIGGCKLYKDGVMIAQSTTMKIPANVARTKNYLAKSNWSPDAYLEGGVDEFKVFDSVLSVSEISSIYNNELVDKNYDGTARELPCCCVPTAGNLIANPSFETLCQSTITETWNGVEGGTVNMRNNVCGWTMNGSGMETWENTTNKPASNGTVFVEIDGYNTTVDQLSQTLHALNGVHYVISFDYRARDGGSDRIIAKWNGTDIGTFTGITTGWQTAQIEVVGTGSDILAFEEPSADNNALGSWIDNIRVAEGTLITNCTSFAYDLFHTSTPSNKLYTRISNQPFDINATVVCAGSGDIPSRKITKIYAVTGATCPTATTGLPVLWSGSIDINQTSPIVTIPNLNTLKAYSSARLMLETNSSEFNCSSDTLSIRPARYTMTSPSSIIAGNPFTLTFQALGYADATITDYNTTVNLIKTLSDPTKICSVNDGDLTDENNVSITGSTFNDSISTITNARFNEIGLYNINLKDTTWTAIDQNVDCIPDSNSTILSGITAKVGCNIEDNTTITVTPHHFDVNATLSNFDGTTFTYLSNDLNISAQLDLNITAKSANNKVLKNYDDTCYSKNTTITLPHSTVPNPLTKILYSESLSSVNTNVLKTNPWVLTFNSELFNNGSVSPTIHFNFDRNSSVPLNPFDFNITSASATDVDISGTGIPQGIAKFVYGRVRAYDIATNVSPVNIPVEFEVYSSTSSGYVSGMPQNVLHWYRNLNHDVANQGKVIQGGFSADTSDSNIFASTAPYNGVQSINITSITDQTVHLDINKWLWYSSKHDYLYSGACTQHPCFNYDYTDASTGVKGVSSGTYNGSDFQMTPAKNITNKGVKIFR